MASLKETSVIENNSLIRTRSRKLPRPLLGPSKEVYVQLTEFCIWFDTHVTFDAALGEKSLHLTALASKFCCESRLWGRGHSCFHN